MESQKEPEPLWAILELLGHKRLAGRVSEEERFGVNMGRIDIPNADGSYSTQFFGGASIYRLSPVTEEVARAVALSTHERPVQSWELPKQLPAKEPVLFRQEPMPPHSPEYLANERDAHNWGGTGDDDSEDDDDETATCSEKGCHNVPWGGCIRGRCALCCGRNCGPECPNPRF